MAHAPEAGDVASPVELIPIAGIETSIPLPSYTSNQDSQRNDWLSAEPDGPAVSGAVSQTQAHSSSEISDLPVLQDGRVDQDGVPRKGRPSPLDLSVVPQIDLSLDDSPDKKKLEEREQTPGREADRPSRRCETKAIFELVFRSAFSAGEPANSEGQGSCDRAISRR